MTIQELRNLINDDTLDPSKKAFVCDHWDCYNDEPTYGLEGAHECKEVIIHEGKSILDNFFVIYYLHETFI